MAHMAKLVNATAEFAPALQRALAHTRATQLPALIELRYDGNLITPNATLDSIRQSAEAARQAFIGKRPAGRGRGGKCAQQAKTRARSGGRMHRCSLLPYSAF